MKRHEEERHQSQRAAEEQTKKNEETVKARTVLPALPVDGVDSGLTFERVLEATSTLAVVYLDNLRGKEVDDVAKKVRMLFAHTNHDVIWRDIQRACDPKLPDELVQLVANQTSVDRILAGQHMASVKLDGDKSSFITVPEADGYKVVARVAAMLPRHPQGKASGHGPVVNVSQLAYEGMGDGVVWCVCASSRALMPYQSLWGVGTSEAPGSVVRYADRVGPHDALQRARRKLIERHGMWSVRDTMCAKKKAGGGSAMVKWQDHMDVLGMGMSTVDAVQWAIIEREYRHAGHAKVKTKGPKQEPGVPLHWSCMQPVTACGPGTRGRDASSAPTL